MWLNAMGARDDTDILEIGCAGGLFTHHVKEYLPRARVTGVDMDEGHIAFAQEKSLALGLGCRFVVGDALDLPFPDASFDLCFSHTVEEHVPHGPFYAQQRRVLRSGGRICVMTVRSHMGLRSGDGIPPSEEESILMKKAWDAAGNYDAEHGLGAYALEARQYPGELEAAGFHGVSVSFHTAMDYCPDSFSVPTDMALAQIQCRRLLALSSLEKALRIAPNGLGAAERTRLMELIGARFDRRAELYRKGTKLWDMSASTVMTITGRK